MQLKVKILRFLAGKPIAILSEETAGKINVHVGERISIFKDHKRIIAVIDVSKGGMLKTGEIALSNEIVASIGLKEDEIVEVGIAEKPESLILIKKKMDGGVLKSEEIERIIKDVVSNALTEAEIAFFVSAVYRSGMNDKETEALIRAMVSTGTQLHFKGEVVDKHSIGGIAGNRTTPIVVSICAVAGLIMPKTSSRAITSAAGTADVIESIARVEFSIEEIKKIVTKTNACIVWGGSLGLSPADDKLIQVERLLNLDPKAQLLASVLSKKISVGSKHVLIDIPFGKSAKVSKAEGLELKKDFEKFGKKFDLNIRCVLTNGDEPIGWGIGPLLEIRDIIHILKRDEQPVKDLENKSLFLAGQIFELCGKAEKGEGERLASAILDSGKAYNKFQEIIEAQNGKVPSMKEIESRLGIYRKDILAEKSSKIIDNKKINLIASIAGSPMDKGSGILLAKHIGSEVQKDEKVLTIYSQSQARLNNAVDLFKKIRPVEY
jgi:AMP phosphorylase